MYLVLDPHLSGTQLLMCDVDAALGTSHAEIKALKVESNYVTKDQHNPTHIPLYTAEIYMKIG